VRTWLPLALCVLGLALSGLACGPSPGRQGSLTAGMCPQCGSTQLDIERRTERSAFDGAETDIVVMTCQGCGYSWRAPTLAEQRPSL